VDGKAAHNQPKRRFLAEPSPAKPPCKHSYLFGATWSVIETPIGGAPLTGLGPKISTMMLPPAAGSLKVSDATNDV